MQMQMRLAIGTPESSGGRLACRRAVASRAAETGPRLAALKHFTAQAGRQDADLYGRRDACRHA